MSRVAAGTALRCHFVRTRFEAGVKPGPKLDTKLADRIVEVRRLLRTDLPLGKIAAQLGVTDPTLRNFIKRRRLCNLADRAKWIGRQRSVTNLSCR